ncbi:MAG TPA: hypothetical protein PLI45_02460 [Candidatus Woesebacteria bacterium]|nr:hypothetical protein [Candidatus Woesebacteria bacterium]
MPENNLQNSIAKLEKRSDQLRKRILKNPSAKKFFKKSSLLAFNLREKSSRILAGAGLVGSLLVMPMPDSPSVPMEVSQPVKSDLSNQQKVLGNLQEIIPHQPTKLSSDQAQKVEELISQNTQINVKAVLDGQSLNHHIGYIGFEQHLKRYPGDTLSGHDEIQEAGMAPGLGAFGYFAKDSQDYSTKTYLEEKYYCVVQTLYLENWNTDHRFLKDWYAFRKMMVINPVNGKAVVCAIGDAGPAEWTGKQFGGSPETMQYLDLNKGPKKGLILMLFVDDPENKVPLGPVNY